jgi:DNA-binding NtrC family response regulator
LEGGIQAVQAGARTYLSHPLREEALQFAVDSLFESVLRESELGFLRDEAVKFDAPDPEKTSSPAMVEVLKKARMVAPTRSNVLITGETGTGKGVLARFIHRNSNRRDGPFISLHCGAIPETLIESELFGHERGAFTGATRRTPGKFEVAGGVTIFLDEIGTVSSAVQIKLLQVLQERQVQRLGSDRPVPVDVRILAASNADLKAEAAAGRFRPDLFYRLSVFPIEMPPLRERTEDIPQLVNAFLRRLRKHSGKDVRVVGPRVLRALQAYSWPGNIRELENLVERAFILEDSTVLRPESFPVEFFATEGVEREPLVDSALTLAEVRARCVAEVERSYLTEVLRRCQGRIAESARAAGVGPRQLHKLLTRYQIRKEAFRPDDGKETGTSGSDKSR